MKLVGIAAMLAATALAGDGARSLLEQAHTAFLANRDRARYWNWTTTTTRVIVDASGRTVETLPSVTVDSPIRSDGKRCNAVLAWGDGREPYLASANADERCTVEQETHELVNEASILDSARVKVQSRSDAKIVLAVSTDHEAMMSRDPYRRCTGSLAGTIELDPATMFPLVFDLEIAGAGCGQVVPVQNHYDDQPVSTAVSTFTKGARIRWEYRMQKDKSGNAARDYWICVHRHSVRPLLDQARVLIVWGRRFEMHDFRHRRRIVIDAETSATELAADVILKFETVVK
jgi:hypothetical protein